MTKVFLGTDLRVIKIGSITHIASYSENYKLLRKLYNFLQDTTHTILAMSYHQDEIYTDATVVKEGESIFVENFEP